MGINTGGPGPASKAWLALCYMHTSPGGRKRGEKGKKNEISFWLSLSCSCLLCLGPLSSLSLRRHSFFLAYIQDTKVAMPPLQTYFGPTFHLKICAYMHCNMFKVKNW